ncbi:MAG TPA: GvpL/GvpF family gas vesicle protein [Vulgatibacter sp.]
MAREENSSPKGKYLYSVVPAEAVDKLKLEVEGIEGSEVHPLVSGQLAAIVSDVAATEMRPERRNLSAHSAVLRSLMDQTNLLPVAFGVVAGSEREVRELLAEHESEMREQLEAVDGKVEMGLRGVLQVPDIFKYFVEKYSDLRQLRDEIFSGGQPSRDQKIELGQAFAEMLQQFQDECADQASQHLQNVGKTRANEPRSEEEALNLAVLVPRESVEAFTKAVNEMAPSLDENIELQVTGPWPPYNFVDLRIHTVEEEEEAEEGEEAR